MLETEIEKLRGAYTEVLRPPKRRDKPIENPQVLFWDTEFDEMGLISIQFGWFESGEFRSRIIYTSQLDLESLERYVREIYQNGVVYLISHFSIAELHNLSDLWEADLDLIHKGLVGRWRELVFLDSFLHFWCGLDKVGESVGIEKLDIDRGRIREVYENNPELFERYALRDVEILAHAFMERRRWILEKWNVDILKCQTTAQTGMKIFLSNYLREPVEPLRLGWVIYTKRVGDEWREYRRKRWFYGGSKDRRFYALRCYWGGRREAFVRGVLKGHFEVWDVESMYPHMALLPLNLASTRWRKVRGWSEELEDAEGFIRVEFRFPEETKYPCLPVYDGRFPKLTFPLEGVSWCTLPELRLALEMDVEIERLEGWVWWPTEKEENHPLREFMSELLDIKRSSEKGSVEYETSKLLMNSIIGKFVQRNPQYTLRDILQVYRQLRDEEALREFLRKKKTRETIKQVESVASCFSPEWASTILGRARAVLGDLMRTSEALTGHTDSIFIRSGSSVSCHHLYQLQKLGSGLKREAEGDTLWIGRSAVYVLFNCGEVVKEAHHGYPTDEPFGEIVRRNLEARKSLIRKTRKKHIITPKEALRFGLPLGKNIVKEYNIRWDWDYKRKMMEEVNPWSNYTETRPWRSIDEILIELSLTRRTGRPLKCSL